MINPPELPIDDKARNEPHIASTGLHSISTKNETGNPLLAQKTKRATSDAS